VFADFVVARNEAALSRLQKALISLDVLRCPRHGADACCATSLNAAALRACFENIVALCRRRRVQALAQAESLFFSFCWCKRDVVRVDPRPY
jgi:hypothetical protein